MADSASQTSCAGQGWLPSSLPRGSLLGGDDLLDSTQSENVKQLLYSEVVLCSYPPSFSILYSRQRKNKNKGNYMPVPKICLVLDVRAKGGRRRGRLVRKDNLFQRAMGCGLEDSSHLPRNVEHPPDHIMKEEIL